MDASYSDSAGFRIGWDTKFSADPACSVYPIYKDGDNGRKRLDYLKSSINGTISELQVILQKLALAATPGDNPDVKIAWNTFAGSVKDTQHTFITVVGNSPEPNWDTAGGTGTDVALKDAADNFGWESAATKYAILITDGAPQSGGVAIANSVVSKQADALKKKATLITVGLSMGDVKRGSVLLFDIADTDDRGDPYFYKADSGDELKYVLYEIIKQIMAEAIVVGDVTDVIDPAFYPVDPNTGLVLRNGQMIGLDGSVTTDANAPHGTIVQEGSTYKVVWQGQDIPWEGWHGAVFVKAREDFLGGNGIETNSGKATIEPKGYRVKAGDGEVTLNSEMQGRVQRLDSPRVNVNELNFTQNSTEWTVYIGTEVDPEAELKELFKQIKVEEVVKNATDTNGDGLPDFVTAAQGDNGYRFGILESTDDNREASAEMETYYLKDLVKRLTGSEQPNWTKLIEEANKPDAENQGVSFPYTHYGHTPGTITIKLTKDHDPKKHVTDETGAPAETYTLTVVYDPDYKILPTGMGGQGQVEFHTGTYGLGHPGVAAGTDTSINEHKINVFEKGLQITKTDLNDKPLTGAKFTLYRTARAGETEGLREIDGAQYAPVAELDTSTSGVATLKPVERLAPGEKYYLVETQVPLGYTAPECGPIEVRLTIADSYTPKPGETAQTAQPAAGPYDWTETAVLSLADATGIKRTDAANETDLTHVAVTPSSDDETLYYRILNNPGVSLPSTGGAGARPSPPPA